MCTAELNCYVKMTLKMKLAVFATLLVVLPFQAEAASCVGKTVDVWVIKGHDLTGDGLQHPDPYVKINIGEVTKQTRIIYSNAYPIWYQRLRFFEASSSIMRIEIWEADRFTNDDHLGTCIEEMDSDGVQWSPVICRAKDQGYVKLFYKCY
ncbi:protein C2-DOMAIN ABA-RELATED 11-like isoform X2 [Notolabrus celidotus]|uniref:protein C2-DOMAIN ABA-RELATED 11-like isoform X2 n=1 Tax=Notolabrus celidotus TaxID=1203425 RepID=UPI0014905F00|nr:protein C2-DOMAIN ABA-RELATED 11-like isoform X2 [Notolabrus celidotus]